MAAPLPELKERIERFLSEQTGGPASVSALQQLFGGACQELFRVDVTLTAGEQAGDRRLVLRSDARSRLVMTLSRREEFAVIRAAVAVGVRTPAVHWLAGGLLRPGAFAYFMDWSDGEALGGRVVKSPELAGARAGLAEELARELAKIHSLTPASCDLPGLRRPGDEGPIPGALAGLRGMLETLREPHPALELAVGWLTENQPAGQGEVTLVHGDFRTGNFLVRPAGLAALLDWEFAHFGAPMEDLAWLCLRDWRFGQLKLPVGGFARRAPFYEAYERASGRRVEPAVVHYFEVMGNVRWAIGCIDQGERYLSGAEADLELVAIARRAAEMEYEALRLIERGP